MSAQRDCIHGHLARSCELCAAQNDHATACEQIDRLRAENERLAGELASANRECEVRNERELGYLARAQSAEAELAALRAAAERLHESMCNAVEQMNISPGVAGCPYGRSAHLVLRKALIGYADSARSDT